MESRRPFVWPLAGALLGFVLLAASVEHGMTRGSVLSLLGTTQTIIGQRIAYPTEAPAKVTAVIVTMLPGEATGWHRHDVPMFGYILEGEVTVDYGAKGTRVYKKGDALMEAIDWEHNGRNSGSGAGTRPCRVHGSRGRARHRDAAKPSASVKIARLGDDARIARMCGPARVHFV